MRYVHGEFLKRLRPAVLQALIVNVVKGSDRRVIATDPEGTRYFVDPWNNAGRAVMSAAGYEPETRDLLRHLLKPGDLFVDVGANEGVLSTLAARLVGPSGRVIAVEPQAALHPIIEVNSSLNNVDGILQVVHGALGGEPGTVAVLNVYPGINSGATSIVRSARFTRRRITAPFVSFSDLVNNADLVKVDVEGFEPEVVNHLLPSLEAGKVRQLLVDYHAGILERRGITPESIHIQILKAGMIMVSGATTSGYALYSAPP
jgi:FkbM family methyltransferase